MDHLELQSAVKRLGIGECPCCYSSLFYFSNEVDGGKLEKNGMNESVHFLTERHEVYCKVCGYHSKAIRIGLKLIPVDRIVETDISWDKKYLEENTLVFGKQGKNPFKKEDKE